MGYANGRDLREDKEHREAGWGKSRLSPYQAHSDLWATALHSQEASSPLRTHTSS